MRVAGGVALVVGTILSLVNQGSVVLGGEASWLTWLRVGVNYLTPLWWPASVSGRLSSRARCGLFLSGGEVQLPLNGFHHVTGAHRKQSASGNARHEERM